MIREAVRAATLGLRGVAFAIWLAPLAALGTRTVYGLETLSPWQDWLCALPLSWTYVRVCPSDPSLIPRHPPGMVEAGEVALVLFLILLAGLAYLRPLASLAWFLILGWGVPTLLLYLFIQGMQEEGEPALPMPDMHNASLLVLMLLVGALAIHLGRYLDRPRPARA